MKRSQEAAAWVVYLMTIRGKANQVNAVCEQAEWDALEQNRPGYHTLVREGIATEAEAEKLARGTSGDKLGTRSRRL